MRLAPTMPDEPDAAGRAVAAAGPDLAAEIVGELNALPEPERRAMMAMLVETEAVLTTHAGPLPSPETFAAYGQTYADAPREILALIVVAATVLGCLGHDGAAIAMASTGGVVVAAGALLQGRDLYGKAAAPRAGRAASADAPCEAPGAAEKRWMHGLTPQMLNDFAQDDGAKLLEERAKRLSPCVAAEVEHI